MTWLKLSIPLVSCNSHKYAVFSKKKQKNHHPPQKKTLFLLLIKNIIISTVLKTRHFLICFSRNTTICLVYLISTRKQDNDIGNPGETVRYFSAELPPCFSRCLPLLKSLTLGKKGAAEMWAAFLKLVSWFFNFYFNRSCLFT